jgi:hypothetical protein
VKTLGTGLFFCLRCSDDFDEKDKEKKTEKDKEDEFKKSSSFITISKGGQHLRIPNMDETRTSQTKHRPRVVRLFRKKTTAPTASD